MKIVTISGCRPDFIRLMPVVEKMDRYFQHTLIWAGQNYEVCLSNQFFTEFGRQPDRHIFNKDKRGIEYIAHAITVLENMLNEIKPDCVLVLGDTNASFAAAFVTKKLGITLFHWEAGNRCYDPDKVPEEMNRYMIDAIADWHLCYTQRAREHLMREGKRLDRIVVVGNPIAEAIGWEVPSTPTEPPYYLVTLHRKENIDDNERLQKIFERLGQLDYKVRVSEHPSLKSKVLKNCPKNIKFFEPTNFHDFLKLEKNAECVITDSGTVPEECHCLQRPCVLLRYSTERPELLESNDTVVCSDPDELHLAVQIAMKGNYNMPIPEYHKEASWNVVKILMRWNHERN